VWRQFTLAYVYLRYRVAHWISKVWYRKKDCICSLCSANVRCQRGIRRPLLQQSRSIFYAHRAHSSKPAEAACGGLMGQTDVWQLHRPRSAYYAGNSKIWTYVQWRRSVENIWSGSESMGWDEKGARGTGPLQPRRSGGSTPKTAWDRHVVAVEGE